MRVHHSLWSWRDRPSLNDLPEPRRRRGFLLHGRMRKGSGLEQVCEASRLDGSGESLFNKNYSTGAWVARSVKRPTLAQVTILQVMSLRPAWGTMLTSQSLLQTLCLPPLPALPIPCSIAKINIKETNFISNNYSKLEWIFTENEKLTSQIFFSVDEYHTFCFYFWLLPGDFSVSHLSSGMVKRLLTGGSSNAVLECCCGARLGSSAICVPCSMTH